MNADELIESWVADVAVQLPRRQRNDVAFELRSLLREELLARAEDSGHDADVQMATGLLHDFGHPDAVAARYRPTLTIIEPADGHHFLKAMVIGLAVIWGAGLFVQLGQPMSSGWDLLLVVSRWWVGTVIPSLWWPGVLVVWFAMAAWTRRCWPSTGDWKPRANDRIQGGRAALLMGMVGIVCGVCILYEPGFWLDYFWSGRVAPQAIDALTYTEEFRQRQGLWLFVLLLLNIPLMIGVFISGRWSPGWRQLSLALGLLDCVVMAWTILDGPVFLSAVSNETAKGAMALIIAGVILTQAIRFYRSVTPMPDGPVRVQESQ